MSPEDKGFAISNMPELARAHNSHAAPMSSQKEQQLKQSSSVSSGAIRISQRHTSSLEAFHFVSFLPINGRLIELDGLKEFPIDHGLIDGDWTEKFRKLIRARIETPHGVEHDIRYNLMAVIPSRFKEAYDKLGRMMRQREVLLNIIDLLEFTEHVGVYQDHAYIQGETMKNSFINPFIVGDALQGEQIHLPKIDIDFIEETQLQTEIDSKNQNDDSLFNSESEKKLNNTNLCENSVKITYDVYNNLLPNEEEYSKNEMKQDIESERPASVISNESTDSFVSSDSKLESESLAWFERIKLKEKEIDPLPSGVLSPPYKKIYMATSVNGDCDRFWTLKFECKPNYVNHLKDSLPKKINGEILEKSEKITKNTQGSLFTYEPHEVKKELDIELVEFESSNSNDKRTLDRTTGDNIEKVKRLKSLKELPENTSNIEILEFKSETLDAITGAENNEVIEFDSKNLEFGDDTQKVFIDDRISGETQISIFRKELPSSNKNKENTIDKANEQSTKKEDEEKSKRLANRDSSENLDNNNSNNVQSEKKLMSRLLKLARVQKNSKWTYLEFERQIKPLMLSDLTSLLRHLNHEIHRWRRILNEERRTLMKQLADDNRRVHDYDSFINLFLTLAFEQDLMDQVLLPTGSSAYNPAPNCEHNHQTTFTTTQSNSKHGVTGFGNEISNGHDQKVGTTSDRSESLSHRLGVDNDFYLIPNTFEISDHIASQQLWYNPDDPPHLPW